ncbi:hypothetical protein M413DRAFT_427700 [Hebeloma cylindrosporum]|uniref:DNA 3'-5' helicase n=1 Tax=Hebeloma cylindrosporum TaxID=76867 RepID=A0A0C3BHR9_HEBCY|nr:hypothetical protein M413DRAFT_427700 [Hebeloma cylindrosporum h7]
MASSSNPNPRPHVPSLSEIRDRTVAAFGVRPCLWQIQVVQAILRGDKNVISIAGTGMGKTLTFWMPLLFRPPGSIQVVVTPLNILGKQNVACLDKAGFKGIFISAESATPENFRAIEELKYQAIIINPEQLVKVEGGFENLATKNPGFADRIISTIFDEGHCISAWGSFRPEYSQVGRIRLLLPNTRILITSATLPELVLHDVLKILGLPLKDMEIFRRSSDRPNIHLVVRPIQSAISSFADLSFLLQNWQPGDPPPPKFLVFFDDINESIRACLYLRSLLPPSFRHKLKWFNSDMSNKFKDTETRNLMLGESWGNFATDSFGMGLDISDIRMDVQWRATCSMSTLWQRFGRGGRDQSLEAVAIFLVEKEHFDETKERKAEKKSKKAAAKKRNQKSRNDGPPPEKRPRTSQHAPVLQARQLPNQEVVIESDGTSSESESDAEGCEQLNERYTTRPIDQSIKRKRKRADREIGPAMDDFINAKRRGFPCRRKPSNAFFQNNKAGKYLLRASYHHD